MLRDEYLPWLVTGHPDTHIDQSLIAKDYVEHMARISISRSDMFPSRSMA